MSPAFRDERAVGLSASVSCLSPTAGLRDDASGPACRADSNHVVDAVRGMSGSGSRGGGYYPLGSGGDNHSVCVRTHACLRVRSKGKIVKTPRVLQPVKASLEQQPWIALFALAICTVVVTPAASYVLSHQYRSYPCPLFRFSLRVECPVPLTCLHQVKMTGRNAPLTPFPSAAMSVHLQVRPPSSVCVCVPTSFSLFGVCCSSLILCNVSVCIVCRVLVCLSMPAGDLPSPYDFPTPSSQLLTPGSAYVATTPGGGYPLTPADGNPSSPAISGEWVTTTRVLTGTDARRVACTAQASMRKVRASEQLLMAAWASLWHQMPLFCVGVISC